MSNKLHEQAELLDRLHEARLYGTAPPPMTPQMREELVSDRFIREDEYGEVHITERGEEHVQRLRAEGHLRRHPGHPDDHGKLDQLL